MRLRDVNFFLQHQDSMHFYRKKRIGLSGTIRSTVFLVSKSKQAHAHTTYQWVRSFSPADFPAPAGLHFFSPSSPHGTPRLQIPPTCNLDLKCHPRNRLSTPGN